MSEAKHAAFYREEAFHTWMEHDIKSHKGWAKMPDDAIGRGKHLETLMRFAWRAGAEYERRLQEPRQ